MTYSNLTGLRRAVKNILLRVKVVSSNLASGIYFKTKTLNKSYSSLFYVNIMETNLQNTKLKIGDKAPDFSLPGVDGKTYTLHDFRNKKIIVVVFMCNHCPYVQGSIERIKSIQSDYGIKGVQIVGINANDEVNYPDDSFEKMIEVSKAKNFNFTYLRDQDQKIATAYDAQCTPECFAFDAERKLRYHGRVDDSPKDETKVNVTDLRNAVEALVHNKKVAMEVAPAIGCSIKWK